MQFLSLGYDHLQSASLTRSSLNETKNSSNDIFEKNETITTADTTTSTSAPTTTNIGSSTPSEAISWSTQISGQYQTESTIDLNVSATKPNSFTTDGAGNATTVNPKSTTKPMENDVLAVNNATITEPNSMTNQTKNETSKNSTSSHESTESISSDNGTHTANQSSNSFNTTTSTQNDNFNQTAVSSEQKDSVVGSTLNITTMKTSTWASTENNERLTRSTTDLNTSSTEVSTRKIPNKTNAPDMSSTTTYSITGATTSSVPEIESSSYYGGSTNGLESSSVKNMQTITPNLINNNTSAIKTTPTTEMNDGNSSTITSVTNWLTSTLFPSSMSSSTERMSEIENSTGIESQGIRCCANESAEISEKEKRHSFSNSFVDLSFENAPGAKVPTLGVVVKKDILLNLIISLNKSVESP